MISAEVLAPYVNTVIKTIQKNKSKTREKSLRSKLCTVYVTVEGLDTYKGSAL